MKFNLCFHCLAVNGGAVLVRKCCFKLHSHRLMAQTVALPFDSRITYIRRLLAFMPALKNRSGGKGKYSPSLTTLAVDMKKRSQMK